MGEVTQNKPESSFGMRHVVIFLLFLSTVTSYATRVSMSLAIVAMTKSNEHGFPVFEWEQSIRDTILSSFFWGYIVLQIPAGLLAGRFGGKMLIFVSMLITGVVNMFTPLMATQVGWLTLYCLWLIPVSVMLWRRPQLVVAEYSLDMLQFPVEMGSITEAVGSLKQTYTDRRELARVVVGSTIEGDWIAVCACRILMGLAQGLLYPSIHGVIGQWAPLSERSRMGTIVYSGSQLGTIIEMVVAGWLSESRWGWPSVFYIAGATCFVFSALWYIFGASTPGTCRWISKEERKFIELSAGATDISQQKKVATPWKSIWTSLPFWAILLAHCGQSLGFWTLLTEMPSYMDKVLGVAIKDNGIYSALPYLAMYILSFVFSWSADFLINRNILTHATTRKIFNTIAFWGPAAALLGLSYIPPGHIPLAVAMLTVTVGLNGAHYVGFLISHIDLSPNFASTLMGITNGCGNIFSIMAPLSVTLVVHDEHSAYEWRKVFFISIAFYFLSNLFFILFFSGTVQPWNEPKLNNSIEDGAKEKEDKTATKMEKIEDQKL